MTDYVTKTELPGAISQAVTKEIDAYDKKKEQEENSKVVGDWKTWVATEFNGFKTEFTAFKSEWVPFNASFPSVFNLEEFIKEKAGLEYRNGFLRREGPDSPNNRIARAEAKITALEGKATEATTKIAELEGKATDAAQKIRDHGTAIQTAERRITAANNRITSLDTKVGNAETKITRLKETVQRMNRRSASTRNQARGIRTDAQVQNATSDIQRLERQVHLLTSALS
ncbi:hypothetical protein ACGFRB_02755 [Streptomyces sp. NPDC048718]|uniref:hypothetical protein n=1 Tax=Streptomyces sp. NPDC048718 TaxID=3365587 RepID=UPI003724052B